jgi:hypothetical protein
LLISVAEASDEGEAISLLPSAIVLGIQSLPLTLRPLSFNHPVSSFPHDPSLPLGVIPFSAINLFATRVRGKLLFEEQCGIAFPALVAQKEIPS